MALDRETPQSLRNYLASDPWTFQNTSSQTINQSFLRGCYQEWQTYDSDTKLALLLSLLGIKKIHLPNLEQILKEIIRAGLSDTDEWVQLISKMLADFPRTGTLNFDIENIIPLDTQPVYQQLKKTIKQNVIKFHPSEYAYINRDICDTFSSLSLNSDSDNSSVVLHFQLNQTYLAPRTNRLSLLRNQQSIANMDYISNSASSQSSKTPAANPSLFIPKQRRSSQVLLKTPSNTLPQRPAPINTARANSSGHVPSLGSLNVAESPTDITTGKTFQKPTRIQMLDVVEGTSIIKNQQESLLKTQQEEAKYAKEKEKREKAAAKQASVSSTNGSNNIAAVGYRKKRRINSVVVLPDSSIQEEQFSDEDNLPHKTAETSSVASPLSSSHSSYIQSSSIPQPPLQSPIFSEPRHNNLGIIPEHEIIDTRLNPQALNSTQDSTTINTSDNSNNNDISAHIRDGVLSLTNALKDEDRRTILNFLDGSYERQVESGGGSNDDIRSILMHVERTTNYEEGREIIESVVFEMNLTQGTWRKIKKKKTKRNAFYDGLNGKSTGNDHLED
ncbi:7284_t:CDS:2 [Ambispora gerdemannii]|uniref:7284_t:CDS:1 n=1 Tax=Ambispora gerdemannii TaxID=144530 RepID=A0A9N8ZH62_9GLOM|nr:7284_t:CDS:2 [Ambispora gerdemannii]